MLSKKELLKRLNEHPLYKAALASVDDSQGKKIAAIVERFLGQASEGLVPMISKINDPDALKTVRLALKENGDVVNITEPVSGSRKI